MSLTGKQIKGLIATHRKKGQSDQNRWDRYRAWYTSDFWGPQKDQPQGSGAGGSEQDLAMETNYPFAFVDTMVANVCPTNPQVSVKARRQILHGAARFREALINDTLHRTRAHRVLWSAATQASICPRALIKTVWNLRRQSPDFLVIDPRYVWFDLSAGRWEDIRYLVEVTVLTREEFEGRIRGKGRKGKTYSAEVADRADFGTYPEWLRDSTRDRSLINEATKEVFEWVTIYEVYDFTDEGRYYHFLADSDDPLFAGDLPYRFVRNPFYLLTFNENLMDIGGLSDVKLIAPSLERLNELDTLAIWFAQSSIPFLAVNSGLADNPEDLKAQIRSGPAPGTVLDIRGKANARINDIIGTVGSPNLEPQFGQQRDRLVQVIEFVLGIPQYSRGVVGVTDVATEVALADSATRTRNGRRMEQIHDSVAWMGRVIMGLYEEFLDDAEVLHIRLTDSPETLELTRSTMAAREMLNARGEEPLEYDYETVPYSPTENNKLVQLRNVQSFLKVLLGNPAIDQVRLIRKLLELLQMEDLLQPPEKLKQQAEAAAGPKPGAPPPPPGGPPPSGNPAIDRVATGAMPPGAEPPLPPSPMGGAGHPSPLPAGFGGSPLPMPGK
jgi:hypothetical protein